MYLCNHLVDWKDRTRVWIVKLHDSYWELFLIGGLPCWALVIEEWDTSEYHQSLERQGRISLCLLLPGDLLLLIDHDLLVVNWYNCSAKAIIDLQVIGCAHSNRLPRAALDVVRRRAKHSLHRLVLLDDVVPKDTEVLRVKLEHGMEDHIPGHDVAGCWRSKSALRLPGACFQVKRPDCLFWADRRGIDEAGVPRASDDEHVESIKSDRGMTLPALCQLLICLAICHFLEFVCDCVEYLHAF